MGRVAGGLCGWPRSLSPWLPSNPDEVPGALPTVRPYWDLVYLETGSNEAFGESTVGTRRPHAEHSFGPERPVGHVQPGPGVEPVITLLGQSLRAVVDVQQDRIERPAPPPSK